MQNEDISYLELKKSIKDKYITKLSNDLNEFSGEYKNGISIILGDDYLTFEEKLEGIKKQIKDKKVSFLNSQEYLDKKQELLILKEEMDKASDEDYEKCYQNFQKALSEISTLNVKLNNSLKELNAKKDEVVLKLTSLFDENKEKLIEFRSAQKKVLSDIILNVINEYNFELKELNTAFSKNQNKMREIPFDVETFSFKRVVMPFESEYFNETVVAEEEASTKIEFVDVDFKEIN